MVALNKIKEYPMNSFVAENVTLWVVSNLLLLCGLVIARHVVY